MNTYGEFVLIVVIILVIAGPVGFTRYRLFRRFVQSQESIADSLRKMAESQSKSR